MSTAHVNAQSVCVFNAGHMNLTIHGARGPTKTSFHNSELIGCTSVRTKNVALKRRGEILVANINLTCKRVKMKEVDYPLEHRFETLTLEEKL